MADKKLRKVAKEYKCATCDYITLRKSSFDKHILTAKHIKLTNRLTNADINVADIDTQHICCCGKIFGHRQSLHRHKKSCEFVTNTDDSLANVRNVNNTINNDTVNAILQDNVEMRKMLKDQQEQHHKQIQELIPQLNQITNINNNQNNCNNKFNLNFFLNEQCKDAMSIQNFIQSLDIGIKELEHMGDVGYVNGMMNIFSNTLGAMDVYKRPLHCTDLKRETLYIKQGDTWEKDTDDKSSLKKLIKSVERKNYGTLRQWEQQHPDAFECDTPDNIEYMKISTESLGGEQSTDALKLNKIMKHVIKEVYVK